MDFRAALLGALVLAVGLSGCSRPGQPTDTPSPEGSQEATAPPTKEGTKPSLTERTKDPASAVTVFLDAVRRGDDADTAAMFTPLARDKVAELGVQVAPPGSDTAKFEVGKVEYLPNDAARVESQWTDLAEDGKPRTDRIMWTLRKEKEGWRVAGMAATVFPGEPAVELDFEKPKETLQKLESLREEIRRREGGAPQQAQRPEESTNSLRR